MANDPIPQQVQPPPTSRDTDIARYEEFTGLRNDTDPARFEHGDLAVGSNIDIDKSGMISRRPGYTSVLAGAYHSLWSDNAQCLVVDNSNLRSLSAAYSPTTLRALSSATARVSYAKVNDRVYFSNGLDTGIVENGVARTWGLAIPALPGVTTTVGGLLAGTYQFSITYMRAAGQESGAPLAGSIVALDGSGLVFTMPTSSDPGVIIKNIYLSSQNGEVLYWALSVPNATTTATYAGNAQEFNLPLLTQFKGPAPAGQLIGYYRGCLFVAANDVLYPSEPFAYELFDLRKGISLDGRITMFAAMEDKERQGDSEGENSGLFLGTDRSCGVLIGKDAAGFQYVPKTDYGAIEGALAYVDGSLYGDNSAGARPLPMWLTTQGICVGMPQMEIKNITRTRYGFSASGKGSGCFIPGPNKIILTSNF